jgi:paraquat-inducible protein A
MMASGWQADTGQVVVADNKRKSLWDHYPKRVDILIYLVLLLGLLISAQCLPVLSVKKFVFWKSQYSLWSGTIGLFRDQHYSLGLILLVFSIIFPFAKLVSLLVLWCGKFTDDQRLRAFKWLEILGRWSMLDVFVVAMIVVIAKSGGALKASPKIGIYLFATAVLLSLVLTVHIRSLARRLSPKARRALADV